MKFVIDLTELGPARKAVAAWVAPLVAEADPGTAALYVTAIPMGERAELAAELELEWLPLATVTSVYADGTGSHTGYLYLVDGTHIAEWS